MLKSAKIKYIMVSGIFKTLIKSRRQKREDRIRKVTEHELKNKRDTEIFGDRYTFIYWRLLFGLG